MLNSLNPIYDSLLSRPIVLLLVIAIPLLSVARWRLLYPTRRMLVLVSIPAVVSIFTIAYPLVIWYVVALDVLLVSVALFDLVVTPTASRFQASRETLHIASLGKPQNVEISVINSTTGKQFVEIQDDLPECFEASPPRFKTMLRPRSESSFRYRYLSSQRGPFAMRCVFLKLRSLLGLWDGYYELPCSSDINVYPDMQQISQYELLARTNRLSLVGVRRCRKVGQENEFERLRDYTQDDNFKHIDWRSTARRQKLTVRDYQSNQSQRVVFMIDCGRMMTNTTSGLSMLDHALNAVLMLSYVALKQGDSVGMICFSDEIHSYTPPRNGVNQINRLLHASFDRQPQFVESNYQKAFLYLRRNCLKRSLVVLVTNVIDEINSFQIRQHLTSLTHHHLTLGALLRDRALFDPIERYESEPDLVYDAAAASQILSWRHQVISDIRRSGVLAIDAFPDELTAQLINQYLDIKSRSLL